MKNSFIVKFILVAIIFILSYSSAFANRGIEVVPIKDKTGTQVGLYKESHALIIGISDYIEGWPNLPGVKKDMRLVQTALEANGFHVVKKENLNRRGLEDAFNNFINRYGHEPEARLLFYFAGHGHTLKLAYGGDMGYIIPTDAPNPNRNQPGFLSKALDMKTIEVYAQRIQAKHALFLFDSCFSGSIFALSRAVPDNINYKTSEPVRQFITAGSADELVSDESIFRQQFIAAIQGEGDTDQDGYVTGVELGEFLQKKVVNYSNESQHPQYGKIRNPYLDKGDFVFPLNKEKSSKIDLNKKKRQLEARLKALQEEEQKQKEIDELQRKIAEKEKRLARERKELQNVESLSPQLKKTEEKEKIFPRTKLTKKQLEEILKSVLQKPGEKTTGPSFFFDPDREWLTATGEDFSLNPTTKPKYSNQSEKCLKNMVKIPGGEYMAGSAKYTRESPVHAILVDDFCMDKYEVTQAEFESVMGSNPSRFKGPNRPVEKVTWFEAKEYCEKVGKRLSTEAEWEKAARGKSTEGSYWYRENSELKTHPVGQKNANGYGLHDMLGNVWEWTADWYGKDYYKNASRRNPKGPSKGTSRVLRGGSWADRAEFVRPAYRYGIMPSGRLLSVGFRCVQ
jgi:formylglycine-generating enzyme required for sulfatase activity